VDSSVGVVADADAKVFEHHPFLTICKMVTNSQWVKSVPSPEADEQCELNLTFVQNIGFLSSCFNMKKW
jgi:hypothetical protein